MSPATDPAVIAEVRTRHRGGEVFRAHELVVEGDLVTASGRWSRRVGAHWREQLTRADETYSWPVRELRSIRYLGEHRP